VIVQVGDPATNEGWVDVVGVTSVVITRGSYAAPGTLRFRAVQVPQDELDDPPPERSSAPSRALDLRSRVTALHVLDHAPVAAVGTADGRVVRASLDGPTAVASASLGSPVRSVSVDGNDRLAVAALADGRLVRMDARTLAVTGALALPPGPAPLQVIASSAGTHAYVVRPDAVISVSLGGAMAVEGAWSPGVLGEPVRARGLGPRLLVALSLSGRLSVASLRVEGGLFLEGSAPMAPDDAGPIDIDAWPDGRWAVLCSTGRVVLGEATGPFPRRTGATMVPDGAARALDVDPVTSTVLVLVGDPPRVVRLASDGRRLGVAGGTDWAPATALRAAPGGALAVAAGTALVVLAEQGSTVGRSAARSRFYPYQRVRVLEAGTPSPRQYFIGRIDSAELVEDPSGGRQWEVSARDVLAALADNHVGPGRWYSPPPWRSGGHRDGDPYVPNYVGENRATRAEIISDLLLNVIADGWIGVREVRAVSPPNSLPIERDWQGVRDAEILATVRELARDDPWYDPSLPGAGRVETVGGRVDAEILRRHGFPPGSGFGGELQVVCDTPADDGRVVEYFRRGYLKTNGRPEGANRWGYNFLLTYGPPPGGATGDPSMIRYIVSYSFARDGMDAFSRAVVQGSGEAASVGALGGDVVLEEMERVWRPEEGLYRVRRELPISSAAMVGEPEQADLGGVREATDVAYGELLRPRARRAQEMSRGTVTVVGPPDGGAGRVIRPGTTIDVYIPQMGLVDRSNPNGCGVEMIIEGWTYRWPESTTTFELGRLAYADVGQRLIALLGSARTGSQRGSARYDSGWMVAPADGRVTVRHGLGVKPRVLRVEAALWSGSLARDGSPRPEPDTVVRASPARYDPVGRQVVGYELGRADRETVSLRLATWIAYSEGAGAYLRRDDPAAVALIRVTASP